MSETALALVQSITAVEFFKPGASKDLIDKVITEATELAATFDVSTPAGEAGIRSLAAKLAKVKNRLDDEGKNLVAGKKAEIKLVDVERGVVWDRLEAAQKTVRQPLTDKEAAEAARIAGHEDALQQLVAAGALAEQNWDKASIEDMRASLAHITASRRDWQEFLSRAKVTVVTTIGQIKGAIARRETMEAERAELEALRVVAAKQAQKDRDEQIAREAREAAEALARKREDEQRAAAEAERQRIEDERIQAEARAKQAEAQREQERIAAEKELQATQERARQAEAQRVEAEERAAREAEEAAQRHAEQVRAAEEETRVAIAKAKKDAEDAAAQYIANLEALRLKAETEKRAADEKREREAKESEERAAQAQRDAIEAERQRVAESAARIKAEADAREHDKAHKASVHDAAEAALIAGGMGKTAARMAVTIIAREQVPHIKISY